METIDAEPVIAAGLRHLVSALAGRTEFGARSGPPLETPAEDFFRERLREDRERRARKDFERAWKTF